MLLWIVRCLDKQKHTIPTPIIIVTPIKITTTLLFIRHLSSISKYCGPTLWLLSYLPFPCHYLHSSVIKLLTSLPCLLYRVSFMCKLRSWYDNMPIKLLNKDVVNWHIDCWVWAVNTNVGIDTEQFCWSIDDTMYALCHLYFTLLTLHQTKLSRWQTTMHLKHETLSFNTHSDIRYIACESVLL